MGKGCLEAVGRLIGSPSAGFTVEVDRARDTVVIRCKQRKTAVAPALPAVGLALMLPFLPLAVRAALRNTGTLELAFLWSWSGIWMLFCLALAYLLAWNLFGRTEFTLGPESLFVTRRLFGWCRRWSVARSAVGEVGCGKWRAALGSREYEFGSVRIRRRRNKRVISWQRPVAARWLRSVLAKWSGAPATGAWTRPGRAPRAAAGTQNAQQASWSEAMGDLVAKAPRGFSVGVSEARDAAVVRCDQRQAGALTWLPMLVVGICLIITGFGVLLLLGSLRASPLQLGFAILFCGVCLLFLLGSVAMQLWNCLGRTKIALARDALTVTKSLLGLRRRWSAEAGQIRDVHLWTREVTTGDWVSPESGRVWKLWSVTMRGPKQMKLLSWQQPDGAAWVGALVSEWYGVPLKGL